MNNTEKELYELTKRVIALENNKGGNSSTNIPFFENRIKVLEDARQRQIELNGTFERKIEALTKER